MEAKMATLKTICQYKTFEISKKIYDLKASAIKTEKATKYVYAHPDGRVKTHEEYKYPEDYKEGFRYSSMPYDKVVSCISPKHPQWEAYRALKLEASKWLTAIAILKHFTKAPTKADLRDALRDGKFGKHAGKSQPKNFLAIRAFSALTELEADLKAGRQFPEAEQWAAEREVARGK
jgi:hypothetical protein